MMNLMMRAFAFLPARAANCARAAYDASIMQGEPPECL